MKYNRQLLISLTILVLMATLYSGSTSSAITLMEPKMHYVYTKPVARDPAFYKIINALGQSTPALFGECYGGRLELLQKLDQLRAEHPDWFENIDYFPVVKQDVDIGGTGYFHTGHAGVAICTKQTGPNPDYSQSGLNNQIKDAMVFEYTNFGSSLTGLYRVRSFEEFTWGHVFGKGGVDLGGQGWDGQRFNKTYCNPLRPTYPKPGPIVYELPPNMPSFPPTFTITALISVVQSYDPNEKVGATGIGSERYLLGEEPLRYTIFFENVRNATGAAQVVKVTDQLKTSKLDLTTFSFGPISFGDKEYFPSGNAKELSTEIDLRPEKNLIVRLNAKLDETTKLLTWELKAIDPLTGNIPLDPSVGILPPNINPPEGEGSVMFVVMPKKGVATGTTFRNRATIVFDLNQPIVTNEWVNVIDNTKPSSSVLSLAFSQSSTTFPVSWSGQDDGAGIKDYTIFVSEDGGPYVIWLSDTTATSAQFTGLWGKTYAFYSIARDGAYNKENSKTSPDALTKVSVPQMKTICSYLGDDPKPSILDQDVFRFRGTKGEEVTILLEANPAGAATAKKATLLLVDKITGAFFLRADLSALPNQIKAKLPKTGEYLIIVGEQFNIPRGAAYAAYKGNYCLTLKARYETNETLAPFRWVE